MSVSEDYPRFLPWFYEFGIKTREAAEDEVEPEIGNQAYLDYLTRVITATGREKVDWVQVNLAVILDRNIRADEADERSVTETVRTRLAVVKALRNWASEQEQPGRIKTERRADAIENGADW